MERTGIQKLLEIINQRIEVLYDREHTIGHAYFCGLKKTATLDGLKNVFKKSVLPLLQEYFFDDYEKIAMVLGDNQKRKMYIKERKRLSVSGRDIVQDVEMFMNEKKEKPVVFVDYLQILSSCTGNRNATERQKNDENINELSGLSNKYDLAVFVISSLNRESYREEQRSLRMDSFKETGGIEYSASVILGLQPRNIRQPKFNYEQEMSKEVREQEIVFLKQRYGISGMKANVSVDFHAAKDLYIEKGASGKKSAPNVSRETKTDKKNTENANVLPKKSGSASEAAVPQDVKVNADSLKNTETQAPEAVRPQTQNANLEYPDDPRARLAEEFRSLL